MSEPFGLIGSFQVDPARRDEFVSILFRATRELPGCTSYVIAKDAEDAATVWITEVWESQEAHAASLTLPTIQAAIAEGRPMITGMGQRTVTVPVVD